MRLRSRQRERVVLTVQHNTAHNTMERLERGGALARVQTRVRLINESSLHAVLTQCARSTRDSNGGGAAAASYSNIPTRIFVLVLIFVHIIRHDLLCLLLLCKTCCISFISYRITSKQRSTRNETERKGMKRNGMVYGAMLSGRVRWPDIDIDLTATSARTIRLDKTRNATRRVARAQSC